MKTPSTPDSQALLASRDKLSADIAAVAGETGEWLKSALHGGATEFGAVAQDYVHAHPWRAIGAAGVAGLLLGWLVTRR